MSRALSGMCKSPITRTSRDVIMSEGFRGVQKSQLTSSTSRRCMRLVRKSLCEFIGLAEALAQVVYSKKLSLTTKLVLYLGTVLITCESLDVVFCLFGLYCFRVRVTVLIKSNQFPSSERPITQLRS